MNLTDEFKEQFWSNIERTPSGCWEWMGKRHTYREYGYMILDDHSMALAHRVAWEIENGPIPDGLCICHHCDNPPCVKPSHLFAGTHHDNMMDKVRKGRHGGVLSPKLVIEIRQRYDAGKSISAIAREYGLNKNTIYAAATRRSWKWLK